MSNPFDSMTDDDPLINLVVDTQGCDLTEPHVWVLAYWDANELTLFNTLVDVISHMRAAIANGTMEYPNLREIVAENFMTPDHDYWGQEND
jgi:hypothetical protein